MLKAASFSRLPAIGILFADKSAIPVAQAYNAATLLDRTGAEEVILQAAKNMSREGQGARGSTARVDPQPGPYPEIPAPAEALHPGTARHVIATRNAKGKVSLSFADGLQGTNQDEIVKVIEAIREDLGWQVGVGTLLI